MSENKKSKSNLLKTILKKWWMLAIIIIAFIVSYCGVMFYYSERNTPVTISKEQISAAKKRPGVLFIDCLIKTIEQELNSKSGWTPNDVFPSPTYFLDNRINEQLGILEVVRRTVYQLNENITRTRNTDRIIKEVNDAKNAFFFDERRWIMPSAESKYRQGINSLKKYREKLIQGNEVFYLRADALIILLNEYLSILGNTTSDLKAAISSKRYIKLGNDKFNDKAKFENIHYNFFEIDDLFYRSQGIGITLYGLLKAIKYEYWTILQDKNATEIVNELLNLLDDVYFQPLVITNGKTDSLFIPNHLANLTIFLDDIYMKISSLNKMLDQG